MNIGPFVISGVDVLLISIFIVLFIILLVISRGISSFKRSQKANVKTTLKVKGKEIFIVVDNIGRSEAKNVVIDFDKNMPAPLTSQLVLSPAIDKGISTLLPNHPIYINIGKEGDSHLQEAIDLESTFVKINYIDGFTRRKSKSIGILDFKVLKKLNWIDVLKGAEEKKDDNKSFYKGK